MPDARRRGLGTALLVELERLAGEHGASALRTRWVEESDGTARAFLARRGFRERERAWPSTLELPSFDPSPDAGLEARLAAEGIGITMLAAEGLAEPVLRRVCALHNACRRDIPRPDEHTGIPFQAWVISTVEGPHAMPETWRQPPV